MDSTYDFINYADAGKIINRISYANGLISNYTYNGKKQITTQSFTRPGSTTPARTVTYTPGCHCLFYQTVVSMTVNDGTSKKIYQLSYHDPLLNSTPWLQTEAPGYTKVEET